MGTCVSKTHWLSGNTFDLCERITTFMSRWYNDCCRGSCFTSGCVHTNRVKSIPIQSSQTHKDAAVTLWLTFNGRCAVHTHQQSRVESHEYCRVKSLDATCSVFVSQTLVIRRGDCCLAGKYGYRKAYSSSEGPRGYLRHFAL